VRIWCLQAPGGPLQAPGRKIAAHRRTKSSSSRRGTADRVTARFKRQQPRPGAVSPFSLPVSDTRGRDGEDGDRTALRVRQQRRLRWPQVRPCSSAGCGRCTVELRL